MSPDSPRTSTVVRREVFGGVPLELEQLADEGSSLDAVTAALPGDVPSERLEELCPYFGVVWPSARAMADTVAGLGAAGSLRGRRVLELGCGLGAPSLVAGLLGAEVLATDYHPDVPALLERNLARNGVAGVRYAHVDWRREADLPVGFDVVLAADSLYLPGLPPLVLRAIARGLSAGGVAFVTDPGRPALQEFADRAEAAGFSWAVQVRTVPDPPRTRDVFVLELRRR